MRMSNPLVIREMNIKTMARREENLQKFHSAQACALPALRKLRWEIAVTPGHPAGPHGETLSQPRQFFFFLTQNDRNGGQQPGTPRELVGSYPWKEIHSQATTPLLD